MSTFGVEPITKVVFEGFTFTDRDKLSSISGLDNVIKVSGSSNTASLSIQIADLDKEVLTYLETNDPHFKPVEVYQSLDGGGNYTKVFTGLINSPVRWDSQNLEITFEILNQIEAGPIGCIIDDNSPAAELAVDDSLIGKPWPLCFGSVRQQPTVGYIAGSDLDLANSGSQRDTGSATISSPLFKQLTESDIRNYVATIKNTFLTDDNQERAAVTQDRALFEVLKDKEKYSSDDHLVYLFEMGDFATITEASEKASETESEIYSKTGSEQKKLNLKAAVEAWGRKYLEGLGQATSKKVSEGLSNPTQFNNDWAEEYANNKASYAPAYNALKAEVGNTTAFLDKVFVNNNTLKVTNTQGLVANINGAKVRFNLFDNYLKYREILPAATNVPYTAGDPDRPNTIKSTHNCNLVNMYCRISNYIIYITGVEIEYSETTGKFVSATYTFVPMRYKLISSKIDANNDPSEQYLYQVISVPFTGGTIQDASVTWLANWGGNETIFPPPSDKADIPSRGFEFFDQELNVLSSRVVHVNDQGQQTFDQFPTGKIIHNYASLPPETWSMGPGDNVSPWTGCPTFEQDEDEDEDDIAYAPRVYITNCITNTDVHAVFVKVDGKRLVQVPAIFYTVIPAHTIAGMQATVVVFSRPPSVINEDWGDEIFVTQTSPVGPNTIDEMVYLITESSTLNIDSSLTDIAPLVAKYPSSFTYFDRRNLLTALQEIGFQSRIAVWIEGNTVYGRYLAKEEAGTALSNDSIEQGGVVLTYSPNTEQLITIMKGKYRERYTDLDEDGNEILRYVVVQNNEKIYGTFEEEVDFYIYNDRTYVQKSVNFWMARKSNMHKQLTLKLFLNELEMKPFETKTFSIPSLLTGKGEVEKVVFDSSGETVTATITTNIAANGTVTQGYWTA